MDSHAYSYGRAMKSEDEMGGRSGVGSEPKLEEEDTSWEGLFTAEYGAIYAPYSAAISERSISE